jgi:hypothetical protein
VIHGTKIGGDLRRFRGAPATDFSRWRCSLAWEEEGKWRGDVGVEEGVVGGSRYAGGSGEVARGAVPISRGRGRRLEKKKPTGPTRQSAREGERAAVRFFPGRFAGLLLG